MGREIEFHQRAETPQVSGESSVRSDSTNTPRHLGAMHRKPSA